MLKADYNGPGETSTKFNRFLTISPLTFTQPYLGRFNCNCLTKYTYFMLVSNKCSSKNIDAFKN